MKEDLTHRDEIHGDVVYDPLARALLDTTVLQRLGRVYQLGYGHLVYRGGTHTRLSHSLGTYRTAARLVEALRHNYKRSTRRPGGAQPPADFLPRKVTSSSEALDPEVQLQLVEVDDDTHEARWEILRHLTCWAGLLHDLGHVPLGHTLEDEFSGLYERHDDWRSPRVEYLWVQSPAGAQAEIRSIFSDVDLYPKAFHELGLVTPEDIWGAVFLICMFKEKIDDIGRREIFAELLDKEDSNNLVVETLKGLRSRLEGSLFHPYMADIVANTISADYLDYLRRDPHNLGLDVLRDDRVVSRFWIGLDHRSQFRMALSLVDAREKPRLDTPTGVVELVRQRYRFAEIVYYHKTKVAASAMLAKVFHLLGKPREIPGDRTPIHLREASSTVDTLLRLGDSARRTRMAALRTDALPSALLDPEMGDESLLMWLLHQAWGRFQAAIQRGDRDEAESGLQALSLLHAIGRRQLYKVALTIKPEQFAPLSGLSESPAQEIERTLVEFVENLRKDEDRRAGLETVIVDAAGWPQNSALVYVPPRKSQAKGIDTGSLADGRVVTLGSHAAVRPDVSHLNEAYANLWRMIVLVHPDYLDDIVGFSAGVDAFVAGAFPGSRISDETRITTLRTAAWLPYLAPTDRVAASHYGRLDMKPDWQAFTDFKSALSSNTTDEELAFGAAVLARLRLKVGVQADEIVSQRFGEPGTLSRDIEERLTAEFATAALEATQTTQDLRVSAALDDLVREMQG